MRSTSSKFDSTASAAWPSLDSYGSAGALAASTVVKQKDGGRRVLCLFCRCILIDGGLVLLRQHIDGQLKGGRRGDLGGGCRRVAACAVNYHAQRHQAVCAELRKRVAMEEAGRSTSHMLKRRREDAAAACDASVSRRARRAGRFKARYTPRSETTSATVLFGGFCART